jgi:hypothetical protein
MYPGGPCIVSYCMTEKGMWCYQSWYNIGAVGCGIKWLLTKGETRKGVHPGANLLSESKEMDSSESKESPGAKRRRHPKEET